MFQSKVLRYGSTQVVPTREKKQRNDKKDDGEDDFQEATKLIGCIFGGPDMYDSKRKQKLAL